MDKKFCDECGKEITGDIYFQVEIYDPISEKSTNECELCEKCTKELKKHFPKNK